jgi:Phosphatidylinositol-4-phosphate 5-Kinase
MEEAKERRMRGDGDNSDQALVESDDAGKKKKSRNHIADDGVQEEDEPLVLQAPADTLTVAFYRREWVLAVRDIEAKLARYPSLTVQHATSMGQLTGQRLREVRNQVAQTVRNATNIVSTLSTFPTTNTTTASTTRPVSTAFPSSGPVPANPIPIIRRTAILNSAAQTQMLATTGSSSASSIQAANSFVGISSAASSLVDASLSDAATPAPSFLVEGPTSSSSTGPAALSSFPTGSAAAGSFFVAPEALEGDTAVAATSATAVTAASSEEEQAAVASIPPARSISTVASLAPYTSAAPAIAGRTSSLPTGAISSSTAVRLPPTALSPRLGLAQSMMSPSSSLSPTSSSASSSSSSTALSASASSSSAKLGPDLMLKARSAEVSAIIKRVNANAAAASVAASASAASSSTPSASSSSSASAAPATGSGDSSAGGDSAPASLSKLAGSSGAVGGGSSSGVGLSSAVSSLPGSASSNGGPPLPASTSSSSSSFAPATAGSSASSTSTTTASVNVNALFNDGHLSLPPGLMDTVVPVHTSSVASIIAYSLSSALYWKYMLQTVDTEIENLVAAANATLSSSSTGAASATAVPGEQAQSQNTTPAHHNQQAHHGETSRGVAIGPPGSESKQGGNTPAAAHVPETASSSLSSTHHFLEADEIRLRARQQKAKAQAQQQAASAQNSAAKNVAGGNANSAVNTPHQAQQQTANVTPKLSASNTKQQVHKEQDILTPLRSKASSVSFPSSNATSPSLGGVSPRKQTLVAGEKAGEQEGDEFASSSSSGTESDDEGEHEAEDGVNEREAQPAAIAPSAAVSANRTIREQIHSIVKRRSKRTSAARGLSSSLNLRAIATPAAAGAASSSSSAAAFPLLSTSPAAQGLLVSGSSDSASNALASVLSRSPRLTYLTTSPGLNALSGANTTTSASPAALKGILGNSNGNAGGAGSTSGAGSSGATGLNSGSSTSRLGTAKSPVIPSSSSSSSSNAAAAVAALALSPGLAAVASSLKRANTLQMVVQQHHQQGPLTSHRSASSAVGSSTRKEDLIIEAAEDGDTEESEQKEGEDGLGLLLPPPALRTEENAEAEGGSHRRHRHRHHHHRSSRKANRSDDRMDGEEGSSERILLHKTSSRRIVVIATPGRRPPPAATATDGASNKNNAPLTRDKRQGSMFGQEDKQQQQQMMRRMSSFLGLHGGESQEGSLLSSNANANHHPAVTPLPISASESSSTMVTGIQKTPGAGAASLLTSRSPMAPGSTARKAEEASQDDAIGLVRRHSICAPEPASIIRQYRHLAGSEALLLAEREEGSSLGLAITAPSPTSATKRGGGGAASLSPASGLKASGTDDKESSVSYRSAGVPAGGRARPAVIVAGANAALSSPIASLVGSPAASGAKGVATSRSPVLVFAHTGQRAFHLSPQLHREPNPHSLLATAAAATREGEKAAGPENCDECKEEEEAEQQKLTAAAGVSSNKVTFNDLPARNASTAIPAARQHRHHHHHHHKHHHKHRHHNHHSHQPRYYLQYDDHYHHRVLSSILATPSSRRSLVDGECSDEGFGAAATAGRRGLVAGATTAGRRRQKRALVGASHAEFDDDQNPASMLRDKLTTLLQPGGKKIEEGFAALAAFSRDAAGVPLSLAASARKALTSQFSRVTGDLHLHNHLFHHHNTLLTLTLDRKKSAQEGEDTEREGGTASSSDEGVRGGAATAIKGPGLLASSPLSSTSSSELASVRTKLFGPAAALAGVDGASNGTSATGSTGATSVFQSAIATASALFGGGGPSNATARKQSDATSGSVPSAVAPARPSLLSGPSNSNTAANASILRYGNGAGAIATRTRRANSASVTSLQQLPGGEGSKNSGATDAEEDEDEDAATDLLLTAQHQAHEAAMLSLGAAAAASANGGRPPSISVDGSNGGSHSGAEPVSLVVQQGANSRQSSASPRAAAVPSGVAAPSSSHLHSASLSSSSTASTLLGSITITASDLASASATTAIRSKGSNNTVSTMSGAQSLFLGGSGQQQSSASAAVAAARARTLTNNTVLSYGLSSSGSSSSRSSSVGSSSSSGSSSGSSLVSFDEGDSSRSGSGSDSGSDADRARKRRRRSSSRRLSAVEEEEGSTMPLLEDFMSLSQIKRDASRLIGNFGIDLRLHPSHLLQSGIICDIVHAFTDENPSSPARFVVTSTWAAHFHALRELYIPNGSQRSFVRSLSRADAWHASGGKSGASFERTRDKRLVVKYVSKTEWDMWNEHIAQGYFSHMHDCLVNGKPSLLVKILGAYKVAIHTGNVVTTTTTTTTTTTNNNNAGSSSSGVGGSASGENAGSASSSSGAAGAPSAGQGGAGQGGPSSQDANAGSSSGGVGNGPTSTTTTTTTTTTAVNGWKKTTHYVIVMEDLFSNRPILPGLKFDLKGKARLQRRPQALQQQQQQQGQQGQQQGGGQQDRGQQQQQPQAQQSAASAAAIPSSNANVNAPHQEATPLSRTSSLSGTAGGRSFDAGNGGSSEDNTPAAETNDEQQQQLALVPTQQPASATTTTDIVQLSQTQAQQQGSNDTSNSKDGGAVPLAVAARHAQKQAVMQWLHAHHLISPPEVNDGDAAADVLGHHSSYAGAAIALGLRLPYPYMADFTASFSPLPQSIMMPQSGGNGVGGGSSSSSSAGVSAFSSLPPMMPPSALAVSSGTQQQAPAASTGGTSKGRPPLPTASASTSTTTAAPPAPQAIAPARPPASSADGLVGIGPGSGLSELYNPFVGPAPAAPNEGKPPLALFPPPPSAGGGLPRSSSASSSASSSSLPPGTASQGSTRTVLQAYLDSSTSSPSASLVLLDGDLLAATRGYPLPLTQESKTLLDDTLRRDCDFLSSVKVVDYSVLLGIDAVTGEVVMGIIDYMRRFDWQKRVEHRVKAISQLATNIEPTVVAPERYMDRLIRAMDRYTVAVPNKWFGFGSEAVEAPPLSTQEAAEAAGGKGGTKKSGKNERKRK